jgi:SAM-dependent methyltransferase
MDKSYYLEYYHLERNHWWFRARRNILETFILSLELNAGLNILNAGAATGATSEMLARFGTVISLEYDSDCCNFTAAKTGLKMIHGSVTELPFENHSFDMVCAFDVIEHVQEDYGAVSELFRVCRPGGYILTTVPAYQWLWSQHDVVNMHVRRYTRSSFSKLFRNDHQLVYSSYFNTFLLPLIALLRLADRLFRMKSIRKESGSDFSIIKSSFLNKLFYSIMNAETIFTKNRIAFPAGVSLIHVVRKK